MANDQARSVAVDRRGNVLVTGSSNNGPPNYFFDYYTAKYEAANGMVLWEKRYDGPAGNRDVALAVATDENGNGVVTGYSSNGTNDDFYTIKYAAADGALLWEKRYNAPANGSDIALAVAVDGSGNVVATGYSSNGTNDDFYTVKYAAADGALLWEKRYNGPANLRDAALAVAVDAVGNVVVTGQSANGTNDDFYTAKYSATNGALLWEKRYNGPANQTDRAQAVALDSNGNVAVTGYSSNGTNDDHYTALYAAADGALLWEKRYNGPDNGTDQACAVAVDGSGNVLVTGHSFGSEDGSRFHTFKYAAADGALLWQKRSTNSTEDFAEAVAVDGSGNVIVAGYSFSSEGDTDFYTMKYAAANGALLWEKRYNGPPSGHDFPTGSRSLAIGLDGTVAVTGSSVAVSDVVNSFDYATITYRENLLAVSIERAGASVRLTFLGTPGHSYRIERASAVTGSWNVIATPTAPVGRLIEHIDTLADGPSFYRVGAP